MSASQAVQSAIEALLREVGPPIVVALDGYSAAGKSTLARELVRRLDATVIHGDDFYRDMLETDRAALTPEEGVDRYFDWERLRDEALLPLASGRPGTFSRFDWQAGKGLTEPVTAEPKAVVLMEGVYSARPQLQPHIHLDVLVEAPERLRRARRRARHDRHEWESRWDAAEHVYFRSIRKPSSFTLIVSGSDMNA